MIVTVARKEWRQQGLLAAAIVLLAGVALGTAMLTLPREWANLARETTLRLTLFFALTTLAVSQGVVTGSLLFAGEREEGTLPFLDQLAGERRRVWIGKVLAGLSVVVVVSLALGATLVRVGIGSPQLVALCVWFALDAFAWASLASATSETTFRAIGMALLFLLAVAGAPLQLLTNEQETLYFALKIPGAFAALGLSYWAYCAPDRARQPLEPVEPAPSLVRLACTFAWGQTGFRLVAFALAFGFVSLILITRAPMFVWAPFVPLVVGAACGLCAFAGTQAEQAERFLGDQRFPPGRAWRMLTGPWAALATLVCGGVAIYAALYGYRVWHRDDSRVDGMSVFWSRTGVAVVLACGFTGYACGTFWMQRFRKLPVAGLITLVTAGPAALIWIPSLIAGLPEWVPFVPALVLLGLTRLDFARWTSGRLSEWRGIANTLGGVVLSIGWVAGWLAWRAYGIPLAEAPFDVAAFQRELNDPEKTRRGLALREAAQALATRANAKGELFPLTVMSEFGETAFVRRGDGLRKPDEDNDLHPLGTAEDILGLASILAQHGWPADAGPLTQWLSDAFAGAEADAFAESVRPATGQVQVPPDPSRTMATAPARDAGSLFLLRAMQHGKAKRLDVALADWRIAAASVRHRLVRSDGGARVAAIADLGTTHVALLSLAAQAPANSWPTLRAALDEHLASIPDFVGCSRTTWSAHAQGQPQGSRSLWSPNLASIATSVPWERFRLQRLDRMRLSELVVASQSREFPQREPNSWEPQTPDASDIGRLSIGFVELSALVRDWRNYGDEVVRARCLRVALAIAEHRAETGRDVARFEDLVPKRLREIPVGASGQPLQLTVMDLDFSKRLREDAPGALNGRLVVYDAVGEAVQVYVPVPKAP